LFLLSASSPAWSDPTTQPDRIGVLARQKQHYIQTVDSLPPLECRRMGDALQLGIESGQLALHTSLTPWPQFEGRRAELDGLQLPATITYTQFIPDNPAARQFELKLEDYPSPEVYGQLHFHWQPSVGGDCEITIEQTKQTADSFLRVFYMQTQLMARLLVFANDASSQRNLHSFNFTERNFAELRQNHPEEVEQWLRPMLHVLQQDPVFAPDIKLAWQVLKSDWQVSPATKKAALALLPALDSDEPAIRNTASKALASLGWEGATFIAGLDRTGLSLEQNIRLDVVLSTFERMPRDQVGQLEDNPQFLLDCQYCDDAIVRRLASRRLSRLMGRPIDIDPEAPASARVEAVAQMRELLQSSSTPRPAADR
jgi:hypothetical protein